MTLSIRTVKREIRILGLDICRRDWAYGAVIRGGFFLDGVVRLRLSSNHVEGGLAVGILATRYYPELRAIMLHDPNKRTKPTVLETQGKLPVIEVTTIKRGGRGYTLYHSSRGTLWYLSRLPRKTAESILSLTWTRGRLPEPARVAHLLARARLGSSSNLPQNLFRQKA